MQGRFGPIFSWGIFAMDSGSLFAPRIASHTGSISNFSRFAQTLSGFLPVEISRRLDGCELESLRNFLISAVFHGRPVHPRAADERRAGKIGDATLVVMDHSDHHLDGGLSDYFVVLIHSRPFWRIGAPL